MLNYSSSSDATTPATDGFAQFALTEATKKGIFLVARPLKLWGGKGLPTKKNFFEALKKSEKYCGH